MKTTKFNKKEIMKRAWEMFKKNTGDTFSSCLKKSWAIAKGIFKEYTEEERASYWALNKANPDSFKARSILPFITQEEVIKEMANHEGKNIYSIAMKAVYACIRIDVKLYA